MRFTNPITGINGVSAGQTASASLQNNRRIHGFKLRYSNAASRLAGVPATKAQIEADIKEIRIIANGKPLRRFTAAENNIINALNGIEHNAGLIEHFFSQPKRRSPDGEEWYALSAYGLPGLTIEIDIAATAVDPAIAGELEYDFVPDRNRGFALWEKRSITNPSAGDHDLNDLVKVGAYSRVHLFTDKVDRVRAQVDDIDVHDRLPIVNAALLKPYGMVVQAGTYPIVFDYTQQATDALDMIRVVDGKPVNVKSFNLKITHAAGVAGYQLIVERLIPNVAAYVV